MNTHATREGTAGYGIFYAVRVMSNTKYVVKEKQAVNSSQNFLFVLWQ
jgi:hypothetical protein